jgi:hypothetical protein
MAWGAFIMGSKHRYRLIRKAALPAAVLAAGLAAGCGSTASTASTAATGNWPAVKLAATSSTRYARAAISFGEARNVSGTGLSPHAFACSGTPTANVYVPVTISVSTASKALEKLTVTLADNDDGTFIVLSPHGSSCPSETFAQVAVKAGVPATIHMWDAYERFYPYQKEVGISTPALLGYWSVTNFGISVPGSSGSFPAETTTGPRVVSCALIGTAIVPLGTISTHSCSG